MPRFLFLSSFMWSYEKIHRCIAHLFLGELVNTFDEEFRILYAQSEPLVIDPSNGALAVPGSHFSTQIGLTRTQSLRNPIGYRRQPEIHSAFPFGDLDQNPALGFRRNDPFRHTIEPSAGITIGKYSQQQFRMQQSFIEQGRSLVSRQMEMSASSWKRHSYAEGTQENYASSRQYMKHRVMNNLDETDSQRLLIFQYLVFYCRITQIHHIYNLMSLYMYTCLKYVTVVVLKQLSIVIFFSFFFTGSRFKVAITTMKDMDQVLAMDTTTDCEAVLPPLPLTSIQTQVIVQIWRLHPETMGQTTFHLKT